MKCTKILFLSVSMILGLTTYSSGQDQAKVKKQDFPLSISYNNHSWAFPLSSVFRMTPHYPGLTIGTEINYRVREKTKFYQTFELGGFLNNASGNGRYFNTAFSFRFTSNNGIMFNSGLGLGILKTSYTNDTYEQGISGLYELSKSSGIIGPSVNLFLGFGYDLSKTKDKNLILFGKYQWIGTAGYWSQIPIRPSGLLHLGIQFSLRN